MLRGSGADMNVDTLALLIASVDGGTIVELDDGTATTCAGGGGSGECNVVVSARPGDDGYGDALRCAANASCDE